MHQIRYFLAVSETRNFTKAAERCDVSQPALTRAIIVLEEELGAQLIHRERANTRLTELGEIVRPHLAEIVHQAQAARQRATAFSQRRLLRVGVMCTIAPKPIANLLKRLIEKDSDLRIDLFNDIAARIEQMLEEGQLDAAVLCATKRFDLKFNYNKLYSERILAVMHPSHPLSTRSSLQQAQLRGERFLDHVDCESDGLSEWKKGAGIEQPVCRSERDDWILEMVANGLGLGLLPEFSIAHPGVIARPIADADLTREIFLVTVRGRPHSSALCALVRESSSSDWKAALF